MYGKEFGRNLSLFSDAKHNRDFKQRDHDVLCNESVLVWCMGRSLGGISLCFPMQSIIGTLSNATTMCFAMREFWFGVWEGVWEEFLIVFRCKI